MRTLPEQQPGPPSIRPHQRTPQVQWSEGYHHLPTLARGDDIYLRQLTVEDITPFYVTALNDPEIAGLTEARHRDWDHESAAEYIRSSNVEGRVQMMGIFFQSSHRHIGSIRLQFNRHHQRAELGIMIFDKSQWRKGYGTQALNAAAEYVFGTLGLHRLCADYYSVNHGSARMFEKAGFAIEGVFKDHFLLDGQFVDSVRIARSR